MGHSSMLLLVTRRYGRFLHESYRQAQYVQAAKILMASEDASDQLLAREIADRFDFERPRPPPPERDPLRRTGTDELER